MPISDPEIVLYLVVCLNSEEEDKSYADAMLFHYELNIEEFKDQRVHQCAVPVTEEELMEDEAILTFNARLGYSRRVFQEGL